MIFLSLFALFSVVLSQARQTNELPRIHLRKNDLQKNIESKFPSSGDPVSGQPPLVRPPTKSCQITVFQNVSLYYYDEVVSSDFSLPLTDCPYAWNKVILDITAYEEGTQYDRFGALWINDIEVWCTTTPEPTSTGIHWFIEKDVTIYGKYLLDTFQSNNFLTAYISIPNNVDTTYTGIIYITAELTFYAASTEEEDKVFSKKYSSQTNLPSVLPLTKASSNGFLNGMQLSGTQQATYTFQLPAANEFGISELIADIYLSGHGCEEFYYSNVPSVNASQYGDCGGGIYRELQIFIDDSNYFAGGILPFPVIYTGGINPFLWRPLTGIMSFDIPAHRLDLTPFLGYFMDSQPHTITFSMYGNNPEGFWCLDASLLMIPSTSPENTVVGGSFSADTSMDTGVQLIEKSSISQSVITGDNEILFETIATHAYSIVGDLLLANGQPLTYIVSGNQQSWNHNSFIGSSQAVTLQNSSCLTETSLRFANGTEFTQSTLSHYPLYVEDYYAENTTSFDMQATVGYSYERSRQWSLMEPITHKSWSYEVSWKNAMISNATYNRTFDHTTIYEETDSALENYAITSSWSQNTLLPSLTSPLLLPHSSSSQSKQDFISKLQWKGLKNRPCFSRDLAAEDGYIMTEEMSGICVFPGEMTFCGFDVCGFYDALPLQQITLSSLSTTDMEEEEDRSFYKHYSFKTDEPSQRMRNMKDSNKQSDLASAEKTVKLRRKMKRDEISL